MSDHLRDPAATWIIGGGAMGAAYAKVLVDRERPFVVVGRSTDGIERLQAEVPCQAVPGGLERALDQSGSAPETAIVAVGTESLREITEQLPAAGCRRILLEKPGAANFHQLEQLAAHSRSEEIYVAYNRRFYASTLAAASLMAEDGGPVSMQFEFTEWPERIVRPGRDPAMLREWFFLNSTHVVDLAFHLAGTPEQLAAVVQGGLDWHPAATRFAGCGQTDQGVVFSYHADWDAPGRWSLHVLTRKRRFIFSPVEQLHVQHRGSVAIEQVAIDDSLDLQYKPGLYRQVAAFLDGEDAERLKTLDQQLDSVHREYQPILSGNGVQVEATRS